jgi:hypothetical protein
MASYENRKVKNENLSKSVNNLVSQVNDTTDWVGEAYHSDHLAEWNGLNSLIDAINILTIELQNRVLRFRQNQIKSGDEKP